MSSFIGTPSGVGLGQWLTRDDWRLKELDAGSYRFLWIHPCEPFRHDGFENPWWPGNGGLDASGGEWLEPVWWVAPEVYSGAISKAAFIGVTRDVYGSILGSCVVKLYKTANGIYPNTKDAFLDETTSDPTTGAFTVYSQYYPDTHYMVSYKAGAPDVEGTTVNTLIGA